MPVIECRCGNTLPCQTCCVDNEIQYLPTCDAAETVTQTVIAGPEESLKLDGQQRDSISIYVREFYLNLPNSTEVPPRGTTVFFDGYTYRITEVIRYACHVGLTAVRFYTPCTQTANVFECVESVTCDVAPAATNLGTVEVHVHFAGFSETSPPDHHFLDKTARVYILSALPFDRWKRNYVLQMPDGTEYKIVSEENASLIDRAPFLEVEETMGCCP